jgi:hypothetical protein
LDTRSVAPAALVKLLAWMVMDPRDSISPELVRLTFDGLAPVSKNRPT